MPVPSAKLTKHLYSSFLRMARKFDKNPAAKALLHRKSVNAVVKSPGELYHKEVIDSILHKGKLFNPINCFMPLEDRVAEEFRKRHQVAINDRIDVGFALLRSLSAVWASYDAAMQDASTLEEYVPPSVCRVVEGEGEEEEDNDDEEGLCDFPVRLTSELNSGTLLVAHPLLQGHTQRTVVLLLTCNKNGAYGLVLNRPTDKTLDDATRNVPADILAEFGGNPVRYGGATRRLQFLHPFDSIGGNAVLHSEPPLFAGGSIEKALELVRQQPETRERFCFYAGCCFWTTKAIQSEIQQGFWIPVLAPTGNVFAVVKRSDEFDKWQRDPDEEEDPDLGERSGDSDDESDRQQRQRQERQLNSEGEHTADEMGAAAVEKGGYDAPVKVPSALGADTEDDDCCTDVDDSDANVAVNNVDMNDDSQSDDGLEGAPSPPVDLWNCLLQGLGNDYASISTFPPWLDASKVEPLDWK